MHGSWCIGSLCMVLLALAWGSLCIGLCVIQGHSGYRSLALGNRVLGNNALDIGSGVGLQGSGVQCSWRRPSTVLSLAILRHQPYFISLTYQPYCISHALFQLNSHVNAFQRKYVSEVRRCEEMERKLSKSIIYFTLPPKITIILSPEFCIGLCNLYFPKMAAANEKAYMCAYIIICV